MSLQCIQCPLHNKVTCDRLGWVAQELFDQMQEQEFALSGGLVPYDPQLQPGRDSPPPLIAELFAR